MNINTPVLPLNANTVQDRAGLSGALAGQPSWQSLINKHKSTVNVLTTAVAAENSKVLENVLVAAQTRVSPRFAKILLQQLQLLANQDASIAALTKVLQSKDSTLLKLVVNGKSQWALSPQFIADTKPLAISVINDRNWLVLAQAKSNRDSNLLQQVLRETLPRAADTASLLQLSNTLVAQKTLPPQLQQALSTLPQFSTKPAKLSQADTLKQVIRQNSHLWEANVFTLVKQSLANGQAQSQQRELNDNVRNVLAQAVLPTVNALQPSFSATKEVPTNGLAEIVKSLLTQMNSHGEFKTKPEHKSDQHRADLIKLTSTSTAPVQPNDPKSLAQLPDLKPFLMLLKPFIQAFTTDTKTPAGQPHPQSNRQTNHQTNSSRSASSQPQRERQEQLRNMLLLQRQIGAVLAKLQAQQAQSLLAKLQGNLEGRQTSNVLQLEIPVALQNDFHNLALRFEEDWIERNKNDAEQKKVKRWRVNFKIDLPDAGEFFACVTHTDGETDVQLWAERAITASRAREKLQTLRDRLTEQGILVKSLACETGVPDKSQAFLNHLSYALVDIKT